MAGASSPSLLWAIAAAFLLHYLSSCEAGILSLSLKDDSREFIIIESFGFTVNGSMDINASNVSWPQAPGTNLSLMGFFLVTEDDWVQVSLQLEQEQGLVDCALESQYVKPLFTFKDLNGSHELSRTFHAPDANLYTLIFTNCLADAKVSMDLRTSLYNLEGENGTKDYLSEGQTQLPMLYFSFFVVYFVLVVVWIYVCVKQRATAHRIHILMGVLVFVKALYLFSEAEGKANIKRSGTPHGWDVAFYTFSFLKGVMLFTVIVLIGTGWSFLKPYLQGKEKKVLMIVIPLQVLANIAEVVIGKSGPFRKDWLPWVQLMFLIDAICCCAVLFPIVWSIKHLRQAAQTDGKAARNLVKLTLFRQYYIVVISYIYFTRVVVFALTTVTSYHYTWVSELAVELATLAFYIFTGYKFRPVPHNPYFVLDDEEEEVAPEGFKDDDFEL